MTEHDPRPPSDDELGAWRKDACFIGDTQDERFRQVCDALLAERAAHAATQAENERALRIAARAIEGFRTECERLNAALARTQGDPA